MGEGGGGGGGGRCVGNGSKGKLTRLKRWERRWPEDEARRVGIHQV